jgi:hypothetical protein
MESQNTEKNPACLRGLWSSQKTSLFKKQNRKPKRDVKFFPYIKCGRNTKGKGNSKDQTFT